MTEKTTVGTVARGTWAYIRTWARSIIAWLWAWTLPVKVNGMYLLACVGIVLVLMITSYWNGRWSVSQVQGYAVALFSSEDEVAPLASPSLPKPLPDPFARDVQVRDLMIELATARDVNARLKADLDEAKLQAANAEVGYRKVMQEISAMRAGKEVSACDPVVKWKRYCPKATTVMQDLGF